MGVLPRNTIGPSDEISRSNARPGWGSRPAALARRGLQVLVFDRDRVGAAHREWNISRRELAALVAKLGFPK